MKTYQLPKNSRCKLIKDGKTTNLVFKKMDGAFGVFEYDDGASAYVRGNADRENKNGFYNLQGYC